jgi:hypothetical protein
MGSSSETNDFRPQKELGLHVGAVNPAADVEPKTLL